MSTVANVERKIRRVEGFRVHILHLRGADVRGDRAGLPQYGYHRAADSDFTVEQWKSTRFRPSFPGFEVNVVDRRGRPVQEISGPFRPRQSSQPITGDKRRTPLD